MVLNGVKQRWRETWKGIVHRINRAPTSFAKILSSVSIFGTNTTARKYFLRFSFIFSNDFFLTIDILYFFLFSHSCGEGRIPSPDNKGCMDKNECIDYPCLNGGRCINQDPRYRYRCICPDGFWGENCELVQEGQTLKLSMGALAAILVCLLIILG